MEDPVAPGSGSPQAIGSVLEGLFGAAGPWQAGMAAGELARRWKEVVGAALAGETAPDALDAGGMLTVKASSAAWATQLRFLSGAIAANANEVLGRPAVTQVRVTVDPRAGHATPSAPGAP